MSRFRNSDRVRMRVAASPPGSDPRAGGPPSSHNVFTRAIGDDPPQGAVRSRGCTFSRISSENVISDDQKRSVASSSTWARDKTKKNACAAKNEERSPLPERSDGLLFQD